MWEIKMFQGRWVKNDGHRQSFCAYASAYVVCAEERTEIFIEHVVQSGIDEDKFVSK